MTTVREGALPDFAPWTTGVRACILEALQPVLAQNWLVLERSKVHALDWRQLRELGRSQERVLDAFLSAVKEAAPNAWVRQGGRRQPLAQRHSRIQRHAVVQDDQ